MRECGLLGESGRGELGRLPSESTGDGLSIGGFCAGVRNGGLERLGFFFFLAVRVILLRRYTSFGPGRLSLPGRVSRVERRRRGSRVAGFGGWEVDVIVVG